MQDDVLLRVLELLTEQLKHVNEVHLYNIAMLGYIPGHITGLSAEWGAQLDVAYYKSKGVSDALDQVATKLSFLKQSVAANN
jgi:hypothetical protein